MAGSLTIPTASETAARLAGDAALDGRLSTVESRRLDQWAAAGASVDLGSHRIINLLDPVSAQDAATMAFVLANAGGSLTNLDGGTPSSTYAANFDGGTP